MESKKEFCDLYNENRTLLGKVHCRGDALAPGEFIVVAGIWVFNSRNEILLTKRHPDKKVAPNLWETTGGHAMAGESSIAAAIRELKEEIGIVADESEVHYIGSVKTPPFFDDDYYIRRDISITDIVLQDGETADAKWVTYSEFLNMQGTGELAPYVMKFLAPMKSEFETALKKILPPTKP